MERNIDMKEVSDGRLYTSNDLVKADCGGCEGCSACCQGMGESIVLDPLDIHRLCCGLHTDFNGLMVDKIELQIVDSVILPNLKMASGNTEACSFLNRKDAAASMHFDRASAACSHWEDFMKMDLLNIFCRCMNVQSPIRLR